MLDFVLRTRYINSIVNKKRESNVKYGFQHFNTLCQDFQ